MEPADAGSVVGKRHSRDTEPDPRAMVQQQLRGVLALLRRHERIVATVAIFAIVYCVLAWVQNGRPTNLNYFVPLASQFLHGQLGLTEGPKWLNELVPRNGLFYVVYPPIPAIVAIPFVFVFGPDVEQGRISILFGALNMVIAWFVISNLGVKKWIAYLMTFVFAFGTITWYSAEAGSSWHIAHVFSIFFMLLAILGCQKNWSPWLIGLFFSGAVMARLPLILAAPFFLCYFAARAIQVTNKEPELTFGSIRSPEKRICFRSFPWIEFLAYALPFLLVVGFTVFLYMLYNMARFGSPTETGYTLIPGLMQENEYKNGFFSVVSIPRKLYALLLTVPVEKDTWPFLQPRNLGGLSIFLTTPLFLWAMRARGLSWFLVGAWLSTFLCLIPILLHADPGGAQFGFRYAQDLYPFLLILMVRGLKDEITFETWVAIVIGFAVNIWGMGCTYYQWFA